jgi:acyl-CoA thioester hydrolase
MTPSDRPRRGSIRSNPAVGAAQPFLEEKTNLRVRFNEVDVLQIVWHGHYANYFEEGRRAFGRRYGVDYTVFLQHQVAVPVIQLRIDYFRPALLSDMLEITARLFRSETARLNFEYEIRRSPDQALLASGSTIQVFTTPKGDLLLTWPDFMLERLESWRTLWKQPLPQSPSR